MKANTLLDLEAKRIQGADDPTQAPYVQLMVSLSDPAFITLKPVNQLITLGAAGRAVQLGASGKRVRGLVVTAGPLQDGTTANTSTIFLGGIAVTVASGFPLVPGASFPIGACDLGDHYIIGATATDVVRLLYYVE